MSTACFAALPAVVPVTALSAVPPAHNSHVHLPPNFSAFASPADAVNCAADQGCVLLGTSNYYDFAVYSDFAQLARARRVFPLLGLEMLCRDEAMAAAGTKVNDPGNPGKVYLCGKGLGCVDTPNAKAATILAKLRANDGERMAIMVSRCLAFLAERGCTLALDANAIITRIAVLANVPRDTVVLQERHVAQALQAAMFTVIPEEERLARLSAIFGAAPKMKSAADAGGLQGELRSHLMKAGKPGYVAERYISLDEAKQVALGLGGVPCYPIVSDGMNPPSPFEATPEVLAANVVALGVHAAEFIPPRNSAARLEADVRALRGAGIVVTAGTEHNTPDRIPVAPLCVGGVSIPEFCQKVFWEGACVLAAHQVRTAKGQPGYVLEDGTLNPAYADAETRIDAFAREGSALIAAWRS
jgi:hypothetical protein